ncbi:hypothetical protein IQ247_00235 [Plectonema cf. radiosum LEGE 06105]|uniref:Uncharacterized protein n=1 Tax=Plectonema cf. radiosum LEGE 06105 TaxID=945769 RepID=A0A8J7EY08_9CYAN|nr:hypothetical protein [Plectonema radiosum]MBE9211157.1 hypothetical protein [Plectonema cf. radiosum LEGE 06105]
MTGERRRSPFCPPRIGGVTATFAKDLNKHWFDWIFVDLSYYGHKALNMKIFFHRHECKRFCHYSLLPTDLQVRFLKVRQSKSKTGKIIIPCCFKCLFA